jgi:transposase-like protein
MVYENDTLSLDKLLLSFMAEQDPMQSMLQWLCEQMMDVELATKIQANKSERTDERKGYRSGYRVRRFDTRMGTMYLFVPKLRQGGYIPFFVSEKSRSETALINVIQEAYINGVSTRKIKRLAQSLGIESISRGQVSNITKELNEQVQAFRNRRLEKIYPVLWVDALYEKIRYDNKVINMAVEVVIGIDTDGKRDILAIEPMQEESESTYKSLFDSLKSRGLEDVWLVVSDAHKGLTKAIRESFVGCAWQRCKVHFMRNILAMIPSKDKAVFASKLKQIWLQPDIDSARAYADNLMDDYESRYPEAARILEEGLEDSIQFYSFKQMDHRKISSTNMLERLNREIRRRTNVVGVFPNIDSYIRLVTSHLIEYSDDWGAGKAYVNPEKISLIQEERQMAA